MCAIAALTLEAAFVYIDTAKGRSVKHTLDSMILAIDKHAALYVFSSTEDAERDLEAIDVQEDEFEFCDVGGQRYAPAFTIPPKVSRLGIVDIGAFRLLTEGSVDSGLPERFVERARHIEHTSVPAVTSIETLRDELRKRA